MMIKGAYYEKEILKNRKFYLNSSNAMCVHG